MVFSMQIIMYFISLFLLTATLILFVTLGGCFSAYLYKRIGDSSAWENGFGNMNPSNHIDPLVVLVFVITGWFFGIKKTPFYSEFEPNFKGFIKKMIYCFGPAMFHLSLASIILYIGVSCFSLPFFSLAITTPLGASSTFITTVVGGLKVKGVKLICAIFFLYSISINLSLALLDLLFSCIDAFLKRYIIAYMDNMKFLFIFYFCLFFLIACFSRYITYFFWKMIIFPLYLMY
jgi:hypothetical protein